jgi:hypothetical protein
MKQPLIVILKLNEERNEDVRELPVSYKTLASNLRG